MNQQQAKFILRSYRSGQSAGDDSELSKALQLAENDPELNSWKSREEEFDAKMRLKLGGVRVPAGLKQRISDGLIQKKLTPRRTFLQQRWVWAAAAVFIFSWISIYITGSLTTSDEKKLVTALATYLDHEWDHVFDVPARDFTEAKAWLASRNEPIHFKTSEPLSSSQTYGCKVFTWKGHPATLVCFRPKEVGEVVHVVLIPANAAPGFKSELPVLNTAKGWSSAIWRSGDQVYVALTHASRDKLAKVI